jgi:hypothetical protein
MLLQDPVVAQRVSQLAAAYAKVITDKTLLSAEGIALLGQQVTREAYVLAYNDTFLVICLASLLGLAVLLIHQALQRLPWSRESGQDAAATQT